MNPEADILILPNKVTPFLFRNNDMVEILKNLHEYYIVQIYGMPGLGKSSLLKNSTCFLGERLIFPEGIIYIDFNNVKKYKDMIQIISKYLVRGEDELLFEIE